jgi:hypothetical protein
MNGYRIVSLWFPHGISSEVQGVGPLTLPLQSSASQSGDTLPHL